MQLWRWLTLIAWWLLIGLAPARAAGLHLDEGANRVDPSLAVQYLQDRDSSLELAEVIALPPEAWQQGNLHFGFANATYWLRLDLSASTAAQGEWQLEVENPLLDEVDLYLLRGQELALVEVSGAAKPASERPVASSRLLFPFHISADDQLTLVVRLRSQGSLRVPLKLWRSDTLFADADGRARGQGVLLGMLLVMGLYNLFIFAATRLWVHLWYAGYVLAMATLLAGLFGVAGVVWPVLRHPTVVVAGTLVLLFAAQFADGVLQLKRYWPAAQRLVRALVAVNLLLALLAAVVPYHISVQVLIVMAVVMPLALLVVACRLALKRVPLARPYVLSWVFLLLGSACTAALYGGWLKLPLPSYLPLVVGTIGEVVLLAAILAWRFGLERQSRHRAQLRAVDQARRLRQLRELQQGQQSSTQHDLEEKVRERTMELEFAYRELQEANQRLEELNTIDALTGVRNRAYFDKRYLAEQRRSRREEAELGLVMMDIDLFKSINDRYGHVTGDEVIRAVAQRAAAVLKRPADVITRYGGEEFALLLPNTSIDGAVAVAEAIRQAVAAEPVASPAGPMAVTISLGAASLPITAATTSNELLERADAALYRAKQNGRNRVERDAPTGEPDALATT